MGTFYNSRALEWFECGRTALLRQLGKPYARMETEGVYLPIVEAHLKFAGRAKYDDELAVTTSAELCGKARVRFDVRVAQAETGQVVTEGYTVHAVTDAAGRAQRPPAWLGDLLTGKGPNR